MRILLLEVQKKLEKIRNQRHARIASAFSELNRGIEPNRDRNGRYHAPCDGYLIPDSYRLDYSHRDYSDVLFGKGEYLPVPFDPFEDPLCKESFKDYAITKARFKVLESFKKEMTEFSKEFEYSVSFGKAWTDKNDNIICYAYLSGMKMFINALESVVGYVEVERSKAEVIKGEAPRGKQTVKGTIVGVKVVEGFNNGYSVTYITKAMIILENNSTVYGTLASSICEAKKGDTVQFTATFEHSEKDNTHSYFKRPTKASILEVA